MNKCMRKNLKRQTHAAIAIESVKGHGALQLVRSMSTTVMLAAIGKQQRKENEKQTDIDLYGTTRVSANDENNNINPINNPIIQSTILINCHY